MRPKPAVTGEASAVNRAGRRRLADILIELFFARGG
jgi:hypothetical protein